MYPGLGVGGYCLTKDSSLRQQHWSKFLAIKTKIFHFQIYQE